MAGNADRRAPDRAGGERVRLTLEDEDELSHGLDRPDEQRVTIDVRGDGDLAQPGRPLLCRPRVEGRDGDELAGEVAHRNVVPAT